jgi:hypothetical protein
MKRRFLSQNVSFKKKKTPSPSPSLVDNKDEWRWGESEKRAFELMIKINHI